VRSSSVLWYSCLPDCRYASEVDVDFVRKSIKAIGQTAVKIDAAAERCVNVLLDLIATRVSYVVQEAVVVMKVLRLGISNGMNLSQTEYLSGHFP
jgi:vesicle coat complex subunit